MKIVSDKQRFQLAFMVGLVVLVFLSIPVMNAKNKRDFYTSKRPNEAFVGDPKIIQSASLQPRIPGWVMPLRKSTNIWIANVPLTPLKAPLIQLPPYDKPFPKFLLYKPTLLSPILNQGSCGACWAFITCAILSDRLMVQTRGQFNKTLSVQQLLACFNREGCDGDSPESALWWLANNRKTLMTNSQYGYSQRDGGYVSSKCPSTVQGAQVGVVQNTVFSITQFIPEIKPDVLTLARNISNMKQELLTRGPFFCAMTVYDDFLKYSGTSVYSRQSSDIVGGHAVEVVGYCDAGIDMRKGFDKAYWICRSSWIDGWPTESALPGYFMIEMGKNMCGIESRCGFAHPELFSTAISPSSLPASELRYESITDYFKQ